MVIPEKHKPYIFARVAGISGAKLGFLALNNDRVVCIVVVIILIVRISEDDRMMDRRFRFPPLARRAVTGFLTSRFLGIVQKGFFQHRKPDTQNHTLQVGAMEQ